VSQWVKKVKSPPGLSESRACRGIEDGPRERSGSARPRQARTDRIVVLLLLLAGAAHAQDTTTTGQSWSVIGAKTLAPGANSFEAFVGYPAISVGYNRGIASGINLGARVGFAYGVEGMFREAGPGFKAQAVLKFRLLDSGNVSLGVVVEPGLLFHSSFLQGQRWGITVPVGFRLGIAASSAFAVAITVDLPMWVEFGTFGGFNLPILTGGGLEYFISSDFTAFARLRIGPTIRTLGRPTEVTFEGVVGVGYRF
jgi:hypothetical protein